MKGNGTDAVRLHRCLVQSRVGWCALSISGGVMLYWIWLRHVAVCKIAYGHMSQRWDETQQKQQKNPIAITKLTDKLCNKTLRHT